MLLYIVYIVSGSPDALVDATDWNILHFFRYRNDILDFLFLFLALKRLAILVRQTKNLIDYGDMHHLFIAFTTIIL